MPSCNGSLLTANKQKAKHTFHLATMMFVTCSKKKNAEMSDPAFNSVSVTPTSEASTAAMLLLLMVRN